MDIATVDHEPSARDARLAELLAQITDEVRAGRQPPLDAMTAANPDLADELLELHQAVRLAEGVASFQAAVGDGAAWLDRAAEQFASGPPLPRAFGEYELLAELGRGGMGVVFKARQSAPDRTVALKMVLAGALAAPDDLARFRAEAESAGRLDHPGIVPVYSVGEQDGQPYFSMKLVDGTTLSERLAEGPLPARETAELLLPVCQAIQYAHERGVLHRDLKPSNVLIDREGRPHVTDFGLAKRVEGDSNLTRTGAVLGTPAYMSPEQASGQRDSLGPASDVYSLGAILYQMLTGRPPFQAARAFDVLVRVREEDPLPPRLINPRADRDLEMIALKCLQKAPALRYASAAALGDDLQAYLNDEPVSARSGVISQVVARWFRETHHATVLRNWGLLWMWHSLALIVLCVATNVLQQSGTESRLLYATIWTAGLGAWAAMFWTLRRHGGPVTFVERQIAHVWAASIVPISLMFLVEMWLDLPVLRLSPVIALIGGSVFLVKAGILSGEFYLQAGALYLTALAMALGDRYGFQYGISLFGIVAAISFFVPGLKHYRAKRDE